MMSGFRALQRLPLVTKLVLVEGQHKHWSLKMQIGLVAVLPVSEWVVDSFRLDIYELWELVKKLKTNKACTRKATQALLFENANMTFCGIVGNLLRLSWACQVLQSWALSLHMIWQFLEDLRMRSLILSRPFWFFVPACLKSRVHVYQRVKLGGGTKLMIVIFYICAKGTLAEPIQGDRKE